MPEGYSYDYFSLFLAVMALGLALLARRFALVVAGCCWLLLAALAWSLARALGAQN